MRSTWLLSGTLVALAIATPGTGIAQQQPIQIQVPPLQQRDSAVMTLHANARAVLLDVVVTDGHGHAVHNLKPDNFQVFENGDPQTIASLEEHHAPTAADLASQPKLPTLGP